MDSLKDFKIACLMIIMIMSVGVECRDPVLHRVGGGRNTWSPNVNFSEWASHETFYVGDWLYFGFDKRKYNVLEVNQTNYQSCVDRDFITNITRGGRDVFNLTNARSYYFICGGDCCLNGMKLAIIVHEFSPPPMPLMISSDSSLKNQSHIFMLIVLVTSVLLKYAPWTK